MAAIGSDVFEKFYPLMAFPVKECMHQFQGNCHFDQTRIKDNDKVATRDSVPNVYFRKGERRCDKCKTSDGSLFWKFAELKTQHQLLVCQKCESSLLPTEYGVVERHAEFSTAFLHRSLEFTLWKAGSHDKAETIFSDISIWDGHVIEAIKQFKNVESVIAGFSKQAHVLASYNKKFKDDPALKEMLAIYDAIAAQSKDLLAKLKKASRFERYIDDLVK